MRHVPRIARPIVLALPVLLAWTAVAGAQPTPTPNPIAVCAEKFVGSKGLRDYTNEYLKLEVDCAKIRLKGNACTVNSLNADKDLKKEVDKCDAGALDALCPLGADTYPEAYDALVGPSIESVRSQLKQLVQDVYFTPNTACSRPTSAVSSSALQCVDKINSVLVGQETVERVQTCFYKCEYNRLGRSGLELCTDDITGDPIKDEVIECLNEALESLEQVEDRCSPQVIQELGCPLGAESMTGLKNALEDRIVELAKQLNLGVFHSPCQGNLPGGPTEPIPANVTLEPKGIKKQLHCGQVIDAEWMEGNGTISFDSDLNCAGSQTATDGIIVAKNGLKLNGRLKQWSIRGPQRSSLRTGVGIRLLPGVNRVQIRNFKAIENFGVGIQDADEGNNKKLVIVKTTVRRNIQAGLRLRSPRVKIEQVVADKNGIGMDLSGDGIKVKASQAKGSLYEPKVGIKLSGIDRNGDGRIVQVVSPNNVIELNLGAGIWLAEGPHVVGENQIRSNGGPGILVDLLSVGSVLDTNNLKKNGSGIVVLGDGTFIDSNVCEQNVEDGFWIGGIGNTVLNNASGKKTDRGNGGNGYVIAGQSVSVEKNEAEANQGSGFVVLPEATTTLFKGNTAQYNHEHGFDIQSGGHVFDSCIAEKNNVADPALPAERFHEWILVAGNTGPTKSNKAGGKSINIPGDGGICDRGDDCK